MKKQVLFIQGGGEDGYNADKTLVAALQQALGADYEVQYPELASDDQAADFGWPAQIGKLIKAFDLVVAHSLGASMLLKYLSENKVETGAKQVWLIATPFWTGSEDWKQGLKLSTDFATHLPKDYRIHFYHCKDDDEVPFDHLSKYRQRLPSATFCEIETGGHQLGEKIRLVADGIKKEAARP
ncbi:hypothetical protein MKQ68_07635 [Chitinophaga horti]|uniref:Alpha/beta hydrolase n=1 Tax=Chitinophaga horti TaxID=2920382 RepID=A0ABY6J9I3_9BACT|nr:hypothetical protein [Chitinophaga horti]UYQ94964.1 hypothetical protein MKQ68_07635 [Chitinophaga horti]